MSGVNIAHKSLHNWLFDVFPVTFSDTVWDEITFHRTKMGRDGGKIVKRDLRKHVTKISSTFESSVFQNSSLNLETNNDTERDCQTCKQRVYRREKLSVDLSTSEDRGERRNCCVAIQAIRSGKYQHVIFLTDDFRAIRRYAAPVFDSMPLGEIWSSHDFVVYLYTRFRHRISSEEVQDTLKDLNAKIKEIDLPKTQLIQRYRLALEKIKHFDQVSSAI